MPSILDDLTPQQRAAAVQPGPTLVIAGAGTGKTKTLTAAVAHRIANLKIEPARVLAVTFTNKAAAEMVAAPMTCRICRIDLRTASRKA